ADLTPKGPEWLKGRALEKWAAIWPVLDRTRVNPEMHSDIVAAYCQAYADFVRASEVLGSIDLYESRPSKALVDMRDSAVRQMGELGKMIGLRPDVPFMPYEPIVGEKIDC